MNEEKKNNQKEYLKNYNIKNKEDISLKKKIYYQKNKERIKTKQKNNYVKRTLLTEDEKIQNKKNSVKKWQNKIINCPYCKKEIKNNSKYNHLLYACNNYNNDNNDNNDDNDSLESLELDDF